MFVGNHISKFDIGERRRLERANRSDHASGFWWTENAHGQPDQVPYRERVTALRMSSSWSGPRAAQLVAATTSTNISRRSRVGARAQ